MIQTSIKPNFFSIVSVMVSAPRSMQGVVAQTFKLYIGKRRIVLPETLYKKVVTRNLTDFNFIHALSFTTMKNVFFYQK